MSKHSEEAAKVIAREIYDTHLSKGSMNPCLVLACLELAVAQGAKAAWQEELIEARGKNV